MAGRIKRQRVRRRGEKLTDISTARIELLCLEEVNHQFRFPVLLPLVADVRVLPRGPKITILVPRSCVQPFSRHPSSSCFNQRFIYKQSSPACQCSPQLFSHFLSALPLSSSLTPTTMVDRARQVYSHLTGRSNNMATGWCHRLLPFHVHRC